MAENYFGTLLTFREVGFIYNIGTSTLRKKVIRGELIKEVDVKKFGKTWLISKSSMLEKFGTKKYQQYLDEKRNLDFLVLIGEMTQEEVDEIKNNSDNYL